MTFHVFFAFSMGLKATIKAPVGTLHDITEHIEQVEEVLGLKRTQYKDNPIHWERDGRYRLGFPDIAASTVCQTVEEHNDWVRRLYKGIADWSKEPLADGEDITPEDAATFWHGLELIKLPPEIWTADYFRARMDTLYEVMRGREAEGISFDARALTPKQAAAVIRIFDQYLDPADLRLDVPNGHDYLASSYDGGYHWCEKCGPVHPDDRDYCRKRKCPLREEDE